MAAQSPPFALQGGSHSAELFRRAMPLPLGSAGGVVPATFVASSAPRAMIAGCSDLQVTAPSSGMSVNVNPGQCYVLGSASGSGSGWGMPVGYGMPQVQLNGNAAPTYLNASSTTSSPPYTSFQWTVQGAYYCYNDNSTGPTNLTIAAADPANPRIDVIAAVVQDSQYAGSGNNWSLQVIPGVATSSPVVPALPANALVLAYVFVPAAASSIVAANILDLRVAYNRNPYTSRVYRGTTAAQAIASGTTGAAVTYDSVQYDPLSMANLAAGTFTMPVSGIWTVSYSVYGTTAATGALIFGFIFQGSAVTSSPRFAQSSSTSVAAGTVVCGTGTLSNEMTAGQTTNAFCTATGGATLGAPGNPYLCCASTSLLSIV